MADPGRRQTVGDPLAANPNAQQADRSLSISAVKNSGQSGGDALFRDQSNVLKAVGQLNDTMGQVFEAKKDDWIAEGRLGFMQGRTEAEINASGNRYTMQGWQSLSAADQANRFLQQEITDIQNGAHQQTPEDYSRGLMERRATLMRSIPQDPAVQRLFVAAFNDVGPRLTSAHTAAHNTYNQARTGQEFTRSLDSGSGANSDASRVMPGGSPLALSPGMVRRTVNYNDSDVDVLTRTMLGEAAGEGQTGLAAVAHVIVNRAIDGRYGGRTISEVARAPKQFSAWNAGAGGNNPSRYNPSDPAYQVARQVALTVLSGRNVDMTNGSTHYYSPQGMQELVRSGAQTNTVPAWLETERAKSNGEVRIGGHVFVGRANLDNNQPSLAQAVSPGTNTGPVYDAQGQLLPQHGGLTGAAREEAMRTGKAPDIVPSPAGEAPRQPAPALPALAGGDVSGAFEATGGNRGNATAPPDPRLQQAGTDAERAARERANSANRPVAVAAAPGSDPNTAAAAQGVTTAGNTAQASPQVQQMIRGYPMPASAKAEYVASAMVTQLAAGNDQLFRDAGGIGMLNELGASSETIRRVQAAKTAQENTALNRWNLDDLRWQNSITERVRDGTLGADAALQQIDERVRSRQMTDQHAKALASTVMASAAAAGKAYVMTPEVLRATTTIYGDVNSGVLKPEEADAKLRALATANNMPTAQLNSFVQEMWTLEKGRISREQAAVRQAAATNESNNATRQQVLSALSRGVGLGSVTGTLPRIVDGVERQLSATQWGVQELRANTFAAARQQAAQLVATGQYTQEEAMAKAGADAEATIHAQLAKQNVIDESLKQVMTAAGTGNAIRPDGSVSPEARLAVDTYLRLSRNNHTGSAYMAQYFGNEQSRDFVTTAATLTAGLNIDDAIRKAQEIQTNRGNNPVPTVTFSEDFNQRVTSTVRTKIDELANNGWLFNGAIRSTDQQAAISNTAQVEHRVRIRAQEYALLNPQNSNEVNVQKATEDVVNGARIVGGALIFGDPRRQQRVDQVMGLDRWGNDAPGAAIDTYVRNYAAQQVAALKANPTGDITGWGRFFSQNAPSWFSEAAAAVPRDSNPARMVYDYVSGRAQDRVASLQPAYSATYDPSAGVMWVRPWANAERTEVANVAPIRVPLAEVGRQYREKAQGARSDPDGVFQRNWNAVTGRIGQGLRRIDEQTRNLPIGSTDPQPIQMRSNSPPAGVQ